MQPFEKTANEVIILEFDFARELETVWRPGKNYALNAYVRPRIPNGLEYQATIAGQSGSKEPIWPALAATQGDGKGALVWTGVAFVSNASDTISTRTVTPDSGLTLDSSSIDGTSILATISGGNKPGCYDVVCQIVTSAGETLEATRQVRII